MLRLKRKEFQQSGAEPFQFYDFSTLAPLLSMKGVSGLEKVILGRIYGIINLVNSKIYIGQTTQSLKQRFNQHARAKSYIGNAIRKYGKENFVYELIEECATAERLDERERFWIAEFNCVYPRGYNRTPGGDSVKGGSSILNLKRSISAKKFWDSKSPEERSNIAKKRESSKTPEERSTTARKAAATRNANSTPEERHEIAKKSVATKKAQYESQSPEEQAATDKNRSEVAKKRAAAKTPEEKSVSAKKAAATRKAQYEAQTIEEKALTDLKRSEAVKKGRTKMSPEERSAYAHKAWQTKRANKAKKQKLIKNLIDLIKKFGERF